MYIALAICLTIVYLTERLLSLYRAVQLAKVQSVAPVSALIGPDPLPGDLAKLAQQESAEWARQDALKAMYEMYETTKSWDVVRALWRPDGNGEVS